MTSRPLLLKGARVLDPSQGLDQVGDVLLQDGKVASADVALAALPDGCEVVDATGLVASPGFVDLHCHLREPGFEDKETIATGTRAAVRGGFTTVCCMPNTEPVIDNAGVVEYVQRKAAAEGVARVFSIGAVTKGRDGEGLAELGELAEAGVVGFSDDGSPVSDAALMRTALTYTRALDLPVINHCEDSALSAQGVMHEGALSARLGLRGIPVAAEEVMVARDLALAELTGGWVHLAHVSTARTVELLRQAKARGVRVTAEVTPHHLTLTDRWVAGQRDGAGAPGYALGLHSYDTQAKVNPPLRPPEHVAALVQGLREGVIDIIATDHAPHTVVDKETTFDDAAFGISGLETALGSLLTLVHEGKLDLPTLIARLTSAPARLLGERGRGLGTLQKGAWGDVVLFDPEAEWVVDSSQFASKGRNTPLDGVTLKGRVVATIAGGEIVYKGQQREATSRQ